MQITCKKAYFVFLEFSNKGNCKKIARSSHLYHTKMSQSYSKEILHWFQHLFSITKLWLVKLSHPYQSVYKFVTFYTIVSSRPLFRFSRNAWTYFVPGIVSFAASMTAYHWPHHTVEEYRTSLRCHPPSSLYRAEKSQVASITTRPSKHIYSEQIFQPFWEDFWAFF